MALSFHPSPGTILMCDFNSGFVSPEMVKNRPVVIISPKRKYGTGLCTVVAISTVVPASIESWHYQLPKSSMPWLKNFQEKSSWVKGDMIYRVSFARLNLINMGRDLKTGKRNYFKRTLDKEQMDHVYACVLNALNLGHLPQYL